MKGNGHAPTALSGGGWEKFRVAENFFHPESGQWALAFCSAPSDRPLGRLGGAGQSAGAHSGRRVTVHAQSDRREDCAWTLRFVCAVAKTSSMSLPTPPSAMAHTNELNNAAVLARCYAKAISSKWTLGVRCGDLSYPKLPKNEGIFYFFRWFCFENKSFSVAWPLTF